MMPQTDTGGDPFERNRMVVIAEGVGDVGLLGQLRRQYPDWTVSACDSYLTGIAEVASRPARVVIAGVDPSLAQLDDAIAGLREAAGPDARLLLYCLPEAEPIARSLLDSGADDYLLSPLRGEELDSAIGHSIVALHESPLTGAFDRLRPSAAELEQLEAVLRDLGAPGPQLMKMLAELVRIAVPTKGVSVVVEGSAAFAGEKLDKPVLSVPINSGKRTLGQISVGPATHGSLTFEHSEKLNHYAGLVGHILAAASINRRWRELAYTDELSSLPNRRYLHKRLDEILDQAAVDHLSVTVLLFDVDNFKAYNDQLGHDAGDKVIRLTGELFRENCREQDIVTRYGGDEFAVVFWDPEGPRVVGSRHPDCAFDVLRRFKEALRSPRMSKLGPGGLGKVTISGGLATYPWDGTTRDDLLLCADEGLRAAKRAGKNRIVLFGENGGGESTST